MELKDIEQRIGRTPLLDLTQPGGLAVLLAKVESHNLNGSVKDRPAFNMLYKGIGKGHLLPGRRIIEATSGNTGIGLAVIGPSYTVFLTTTCLAWRRMKEDTGRMSAQ